MGSLSWVSDSHGHNLNLRMRGLGHIIAATVGFFAASVAADHHQVGADTHYHQPHAHTAAGAAAAAPLATQYAAAAPVADPYQQQAYDNSLQVRQDDDDILGDFFQIFGAPSVALIVAAFLGFTYVTNYVNFLQAKINTSQSKEEELEMLLDNLTTRLGILEAAG